MWTALRVAAAGALAQERVLDVAAHNLANVQTPGFQGRRAVLVEQPPGPSVFEIPTRTGGISLTSERVGQGAAVGALVSSSARGPLQPTGRPLDVAILGDGFLELTLADGRTAYTRAGSLRPDGSGRLTTAGGVALARVSIPPDAAQLTVVADGTVMATLGGDPPTPIGRLSLVRFANPDGLDHIGQGMLLATSASGAPSSVEPGGVGVGLLAPASLEGSNVSMADELTRIMQAQRAYQVNLRALRTMDEMLQAAYNLRM